MSPVLSGPVTRCLVTLLLSLICHLHLNPNKDVLLAETIVVRNPKQFSDIIIPCERIPFGEPEDYKPSIVLLPSGELLIVLFRGQRVSDNRILEQPVLYRSHDKGRTWTTGTILDLPGREPYLSISSKGTLFITAHLLSQEIRNQDRYTYSLIHRSVDAGHSWTTTRLEAIEFRPRTISLGSRNILEIQDGSLMVGVSEHALNSQSYIWRSFDDGKSWSMKYPAHFDHVPQDYPYTLLGEAHFWQADSGKLYAILRVGANNSWPLTGSTDPGNNDQSERMIIYATTDLGKTWQKVSDLGTYGQMYMSMIRLQDTRLLLTFTQRAIDPQLGIRAVVGTQDHDGFHFDLTQDILLLETKTPPGRSSGGGFGPTVQLDETTLITPYTYRDGKNVKHAEVVRWKLPVP